MRWRLMVKPMPVPSIFEPSMPRLEKGRNTLPRWLADMLDPSSLSSRVRKSAGTGFNYDDTDAALVRQRLHQCHALLQHLRRNQRLHDRLHMARLDFREIGNVVAPS